MRRMKLNCAISSARKQAIHYCKKELKGSEQMKSTIEHEMLMAIESEALRVKQRNWKELQHRRELFMKVAFSSVFDD